MTRKLLFPTDYTPDLIDMTATILDKIYRSCYIYQKCGGMLPDLVPTAPEGHDLFDERERQRQSRLMKALDAINAEHARARSTLAISAAEGRNGECGSGSAARAITRWREIPLAR